MQKAIVAFFTPLCTCTCRHSISARLAKVRTGAPQVFWACVMNLSRDNLQGLKGEAGAPGKNGKDGADGIVGKPVSLTFSSCSHLKILPDFYDYDPFRVFGISNGL